MKARFQSDARLLACTTSECPRACSAPNTALSMSSHTGIHTGRGAATMKPRSHGTMQTETQPQARRHQAASPAQTPPQQRVRHMTQQRLTAAPPRPGGPTRRRRWRRTSGGCRSCSAAAASTRWRRWRGSCALPWTWSPCGPGSSASPTGPDDRHQQCLQSARRVVGSSPLRWHACRTDRPSPAVRESNMSNRCCWWCRQVCVPVRSAARLC